MPKIIKKKTKKSPSNIISYDYDNQGTLKNVYDSDELDYLEWGIDGPRGIDGPIGPVWGQCDELLQNKTFLSEELKDAEKKLKDIEKKYIESTKKASKKVSKKVSNKVYKKASKKASKKVESDYSSDEEDEKKSKKKPKKKLGEESDEDEPEEEMDQLVEEKPKKILTPLVESLVSKNGIANELLNNILPPEVIITIGIQRCNTCGLYFEKNMICENEDYIDEFDATSCWHCIFWLNYSIDDRKNVDGKYGKTIANYILECKDCHNVTTCKRTDMCFICDHLNGKQIDGIKDSYSYLVNSTKNVPKNISKNISDEEIFTKDSEYVFRIEI
uniref:Uncharacterized protein n=1 Tax=Mimivirus LCMiAC01 TaxID=2506608 RepID=A0A481Z162_9VIRU|nr:MAG: hypothetical protein LCMiAC01_02010 [Mimivirus LCMiAC01]